jgi:hypothetical protein
MKTFLMRRTKRCIREVSDENARIHRGSDNASHNWAIRKEALSFINIKRTNHYGPETYGWRLGLR